MKSYAYRYIHPSGANYWRVASSRRLKEPDVEEIALIEMAEYDKLKSVLSALVQTIGAHDLACKNLGAYDPKNPPQIWFDEVQRTRIEFEKALSAALDLL